MYARMASTRLFQRSNRARFALSQRLHRLVGPFFLLESGRPARSGRGAKHSIMSCGLMGHQLKPGFCSRRRAKINDTIPPSSFLTVEYFSLLPILSQPVVIKYDSSLHLNFMQDSGKNHYRRGMLWPKMVLNANSITTYLVIGSEDAKAGLFAWCAMDEVFVDARQDFLHSHQVHPFPGYRRRLPVFLQ